MTRKLDGLTPRQIEVAQLIHEGLTRDEIAEKLGCTIHTVARHIVDAGARIGWRGRPVVGLAIYYERHHCSTCN